MGKAFPCGRAGVSVDPFERGSPRNAPVGGRRKDVVVGPGVGVGTTGGSAMSSSIVVSEMSVPIAGPALPRALLAERRCALEQRWAERGVAALADDEAFAFYAGWTPGLLRTCWPPSGRRRRSGARPRRI